MERGGNSKKSKIEEDLDRFDQVLRGAYTDPWWREFVRLVGLRRQSYMEDLVSSSLDQRIEDRIRGQITELTWILSLDAVAGRQLEKSDGPTESRTR